MPIIRGLLGSFDNLDLIPIESIVSWLNPNLDLLQLENYIANKILYPQTVPLTEYEMKVDLSILREVLKLNAPQKVDKKNALLGDNPFLNITLRRIIIPKKFLGYVPNIVSLTWAFIDGLMLNRKKEDWFSDIWTVVLTDDIDEVAGSVLLPQFEGQEGVLELNVDKNYQIKAGSLTVIPCPAGKCQLTYKLTNGTIFGKKESSIELFGGPLGIMIDGRP